MPQINHIVLVGHCGPDTWMLTDAVQQAVPEHVKITAVNDQTALDDVATSTALLLVNRVLDGAFSTQEGVELIRQLVQQTNPPVLMLISNFDDAQQQAVRAGARPGFGKRAARAAETADRLRAAVSENPLKSTEFRDHA